MENFIFCAVKLSFKIFLEIDGSFTVHINNIHVVEIELYEVCNDLIPQVKTVWEGPNSIGNYSFWRNQRHKLAGNKISKQNSHMENVNAVD